MARCLVGCGSNLGSRREQLDRAIELLRFMPGVSLEAVSRYRETRPVGGPAGQPAYLNGACLVETDLGPHQFLDALSAVENTLQRERSERWGARTIDLDLLLYDDLVMDTARLTLPHPRMTTRRFVLEPCVEIAAGLVHPGAGCALRDLLANISVPHPLVAIVGAPGTGAHEVAEAVAEATLARPLPAPAAEPDDRLIASWQATARAQAQPLVAARWDEEGHATVADYWLDGLPFTAARWLDAASLATFVAEVRALAADTVVPNVVILLVAEADVIESRLAARGTGAAAAVACAPPPAAVPAALAVQERLVRCLRRPEERSARTPLAVVTVDAHDLGRATAEAVAAVEGML